MKLATSLVMCYRKSSFMKLIKVFLRALALLALLILADVSTVQGEDLPDSAYITGVHGHPQKHSLSCESRSAADLAAFWGVSLGENEFLGVLPRADNPEQGFVGDPDDPWGYIPPHSYGVYAGPVAHTLAEFGLQADDHSQLGWDDLRQEISAGHPVIVWIIGQMWSGNSEHYQASDGSTTRVAAYEHTMILTGYSSDSVQVLDAYSGQFQTYPLSTFLQSWAVLGNMAVFSSGGAPQAQAAPTEAADPTYTVQPGDYLTALAERYGTSLNVLIELNEIPYPYTIYPGQVLRLPAGAVPSEPPEAIPTPLPAEAAIVEPAVMVANFKVNLPLVVREQDVGAAHHSASLHSPTEPAQGETASTSPVLISTQPSLAVDWVLLARLRDLVIPAMINPAEATFLK